MSKYTYTDINGHTHSLKEKTATNQKEMERLRHIAAEKARKLGLDCKTDVFYSLEQHDPIDGKLVKGYYFLIPIARSEVPIIDNEYGSDFLIGIYYNRDIKTEYEAPVDLKENRTGYDYENECAKWLSLKGFTDVEVTRKSRDNGLDVIAYKDGLKYGFQCKYYKGSVPNKAVQEAYSGAAFYDCDVAVVMTTGNFTKQSEELARKLNVQLWKQNRPN